MSNTEFVVWLRDCRACEPAIEWVVANGYDRIEAWAKCHRGDWLLWFAARAGCDHVEIVKAACACVRTALECVPPLERQPLAAIEAAEAWCRCPSAANAANAEHAARAARAVALDCSTAASAAECTASAVHADHADHAASAVFRAARAVAFRAAFAAELDAGAASAVADCAYDDAQARMADIVRGIVVYPPAQARDRF